MTLAFASGSWTNSVVTNSGAGADGGGMYFSFPPGLKFTLRKLQFLNCFAGRNGGGMIVQGGGSPTMDNIIIKDSTATAGGAIYFQSSSPILKNPIVIEGCSATERGGGVYFAGATSMTGALVVKNSHATTSGGGVVVAGGEVNLVKGTSITGCSSSTGAAPSKCPAPTRC